MTAGGWVLMGLSWALIVGLNLFCFGRLGKHEEGE